MNRSTLVISALVAVAALPGCFDSIINGECRTGMVMVGGECRFVGDEPDAGDPGTPDAAVGRPDARDVGGPDATVADAGGAPDGGAGCPGDQIACDGVCVDPSTDPTNCGACGHVCASGLCAAGACVGDIAGHVVVIGHDFSTHNAAMARVIGNAAALAPADPIRVAQYRGTATEAATTGARAAITQGLASVGRSWTSLPPDDDALVALDECDVFFVHAQRGNGDNMAALGASWQPALAAFIARGGVFVVLEGEGGNSHRLVTGTGLLAIDAVAPATGTSVSVTAPSDAVAIAVPIPYYAAPSSVWFSTTSTDHVIRDPDGHPVVLHAGQ